MPLRKALPTYNDELATRVADAASDHRGRRRTTIQTSTRKDDGVKDQYIDDNGKSAATELVAKESGSNTYTTTLSPAGFSLEGQTSFSSNREQTDTRRTAKPSVVLGGKTTTLEIGRPIDGNNSPSPCKGNVIVRQGSSSKRHLERSEKDDDCVHPNVDFTGCQQQQQSDRLTSGSVRVEGLPASEQQIHCGDVVRLQVTLNGGASSSPASATSSPVSVSSTDNNISLDLDSTDSKPNSQLRQQEGVDLCASAGTSITGEEEDIIDLSSCSDYQKFLNYRPNISEIRTNRESDSVVTGNPSCVSCASLASCLSQLKMDNTRLQQLLYDVEQARSGTVKALMQASTLLQNVQNDNTMLQGQVRVIEQEKTYLQQNLRNIKESKSDVDLALTSDGDALDGNSTVPTAIHGKNYHPEFDGSLKSIADTWKKEKREMMKALATCTTRAETAEKDAERLRVQFKKVKEQLDHANEAYAALLTNNTELTGKFDDQFKSLSVEKEDLLCRIERGEIVGKDFELQRNRIAELSSTLEETQDERDNLQRQVTALEKQKRDVLSECDELHEQLDHCEDLMEKMTETEESLRSQLEKETSEKKYLQGCLDETGTILLHLQSNERQLKEEKDLLEEDLETEIQQKQSLKQKLMKTTEEHKDICTELEEMSNIHVTVRESLQQAGKKEKTYQQQIEELTRTNHILHYSLEKEKEEGNDLRVMFDCLEIELRHLKRDSTSEIKSLSSRVEELTLCSDDTGERLKVAEKQCEDLRNNLEQEEEDNDGLRKANARLEKLKAEQDGELASVREKRNDLENEVLAIKRQAHEFKKNFDSQLQSNEELQEKTEKNEDILKKTLRELSDLQENLHKREFEMEETKARMKSKQKKIQEMDNDLTDATQARVRFETRLRAFEKEAKELRVTVQDQNEELGTLRFDAKRFARERDSSKREAETIKSEFDYHKSKCSETMKNLRDEIISLQNRLMDKDRYTMHQKESLQDTIDNATTDLALFRQFMADEVSITHGNGDTPRLAHGDDEGAPLSDREKFDLQYFKGVNAKYRKEMQAQVNNLEGMLEMSKQRSDNVTVVQSPMSKLKLEEVKKLRDDVHQLGKETASVRSRLRSAYEDIMLVKLSLDPVGDVVPSVTDKAELITRSVELERHLVNLDNAIYEIENQHKSIVKSNLSLLDRICSTTADRARNDATSTSMASTASTVMREENLKLKTLLRMLKRKFNFEENEIWVESVRSLQTSRMLRKSSADSDSQGGLATDSSIVQRGSDSECSTGSESLSETAGQRTAWRDRRASRNRSSAASTSTHAETDEESRTRSPGFAGRAANSSPRNTRTRNHVVSPLSPGRELRRSNSLIEKSGDATSALDSDSSTYDGDRKGLTGRSAHDREADTECDPYDPPPQDFKRSATLPTRIRPSALR